ncbi:hypothetical protein Cci01nite_20760 [Catellatospora citrea]|uniref:Uncharacterized protein n=1 Tax=Catellatospora citrea TaxID=53366 RepID=A0A8J3KC93_9ACTN|nr:hypothetical protein Cci01nite_20760 [Catellatospora citrea]
MRRELSRRGRPAGRLTAVGPPEAVKGSRQCGPRTYLNRVRSVRQRVYVMLARLIRRSAAAMPTSSTATVVIAGFWRALMADNT